MLDLATVACEEFAAEPWKGFHTKVTKETRVNLEAGRPGEEKLRILLSWIPGFQIHPVFPLCTLAPLV